jgi:hypothetical protein
MVAASECRLGENDPAVILAIETPDGQKNPADEPREAG